MFAVIDAGIGEMSVKYSALVEHGAPAGFERVGECRMRLGLGRVRDVDRIEDCVVLTARHPPAVVDPAVRTFDEGQRAGIVTREMVSSGHTPPPLPGRPEADGSPRGRGG